MSIFLQQAYLGSLAADALAMPVHWYYDREALREEYGVVDHYMAPDTPHPDSILWRSQYSPVNERGEILHEQAQYWGAERGIHYHQFLKAGENTINLQLATLLHRQVATTGHYDPGLWLDIYIQFMLNPGSHNDTYLEEYHRGFFTNYSNGKNRRKCGIKDEHIGGLAQVPALLAALPEDADWRTAVKEHVALTHRHSNVLRAADCLARLLKAMENGVPMREAIAKAAGDWFSTAKAQRWSIRPDDVIIGRVLSPACYIAEAFPAALYLAWKYHDDFDAGITANAQVGGDNCHRGVIVGALLGANNGVNPKWVDGLYSLSKNADRISETRSEV
ncbi:ADP-ribosylglycohydrolase family protein [Roseibacillus persicicus]|uniref:ADP-ribosylglycohydrolase family protein n=1 Tax=Roseibacillus persicicus TaxID=454148 RepID=UPI00398AA40B